MTAPDYQLVNVDVYALKPSTQKKAQTVNDNKNEDWDRKPYATPHVEEQKRRIPEDTAGDASKMIKLVRAGAATQRDALGRKQRCDCPVVVSAVISWPMKVAEMQADDWKAWRAFANKAFLWLRKCFEALGATFGYAVQHLDESHPHFHVHFHRYGAPIKPCHPGHRAGKGYKAAMSKFQRDFNHDVAAEFGMLWRSPEPRKRIHPRAHRAGIRILKSQRPPAGWKAAKTAAAKRRRLKRNTEERRSQRSTGLLTTAMKPRPTPADVVEAKPKKPAPAPEPLPPDNASAAEDSDEALGLRRNRRRSQRSTGLLANAMKPRPAPADVVESKPRKPAPAPELLAPDNATPADDSDEALRLRRDRGRSQRSTRLLTTAMKPRPTPADVVEAKPRKPAPAPEPLPPDNAIPADDSDEALRLRRKRRQRPW